MIKKLIRKIAGEVFLQRAAGFKRRWLPGKRDRELQLREQELLARRKGLYASFLQAGDLCFDVGANRGNRILPLLEAGMRVVAVEPQEKCSKHLERTFGNRISLIRKGLGAAEDVKTFYLSDAHTLSSFSSEWIASVKTNRFSEHSWNKTVKVEMTTLDQLIAQFGRPSFIKIDVEGYETEVLKGLSQPVKMISIEYTVPEQTGKALECLQLIQRNGGELSCNYSIGESMVFELAEWLPIGSMERLIATPEFEATNFGDIYIRHSATA